MVAACVCRGGGGGILFDEHCILSPLVEGQQASMGPLCKSFLVLVKLSSRIYFVLSKNCACMDSQLYLGGGGGGSENMAGGGIVC